MTECKKDWCTSRPYKQCTDIDAQDWLLLQALVWTGVLKYSFCVT